MHPLFLSVFSINFGNVFVREGALKYMKGGSLSIETPIGSIEAILFEESEDLNMDLVIRVEVMHGFMGEKYDVCPFWWLMGSNSYLDKRGNLKPCV